MNKPYIVAFNDIENWDEGQWFAVVFAANEATAAAALVLDWAEWVGGMDSPESLAGSVMYTQLVSDDFDAIKERIGLDGVERYMCHDAPSVLKPGDSKCFWALAELAFPQEGGKVEVAGEKGTGEEANG